MIKVYDSGGKYITHRNQEQIAALLFTQQNTITVQFMGVMWQYGASDCGLFAIANATALCNGIDPTCCVYQQSIMRKHFLKCLETGKMSLFPTTQDRRAVVRPAKEQTIDVYCNCRMPHDGKADMNMCFRCHEWYHGLCAVGGVPAHYWEPKSKPSGTLHIVITM